eukprot:scaffold14375_cov133-Isochrysis_galbana.AAC.6
MRYLEASGVRRGRAWGTRRKCPPRAGPCSPAPCLSTPEPTPQRRLRAPLTSGCSARMVANIEPICEMAPAACTLRASVQGSQEWRHVRLRLRNPAPELTCTIGGVVGQQVSSRSKLTQRTPSPAEPTPLAGRRASQRAQCAGKRATVLSRKAESWARVSTKPSPSPVSRTRACGHEGGRVRGLFCPATDNLEIGVFTPRHTGPRPPRPYSSDPETIAALVHPQSHCANVQPANVPRGSPAARGSSRAWRGSFPAAAAPACAALPPRRRPPTPDPPEGRAERMRDASVWKRVTAIGFLPPRDESRGALSRDLTALGAKSSHRQSQWVLAFSQRPSRG